MNCPKCGCKMQKQIICPYCKITGDEVRFASNKEAKKRIKEKNKEDVLISHYRPFDVEKRIMILITIFGGFFGIDKYYVGRYLSATIHASVITFTFIMVTLRFIYLAIEVIKVLTELSSLVATIYTFLWLCNIVRVFFNGGTYPVVLPNKEQLELRIKQHEAKLSEMEAKKEAKKEEKKDKKSKKEKSKKDESTIDSDNNLDSDKNK